MTTTPTHRFRLKKGYTRVQVAVQELDEDVVIKEGHVFETDQAGVARSVEQNPAVERAPAKTEKGGDA